MPVSSARAPGLGSVAGSSSLQLQPIDSWRLAPVAPDTVVHPSELQSLSDSVWRDALVPGTVAQVLSEAESAESDRWDFWFNGSFTAMPADRLWLFFEGLATLSDVWLNDVHILSSDNMFRGHRVDVTDAVRRTEFERPGRRVHQLWIRFRSLTEAMRKPMPRARWRTAAVSDRKLRGFRTTLLGRMPGRFPSLPVVGPWRQVSVAAERGYRLDDVRINAWLHGSSGGRISVAADIAGDVSSVELIAGGETTKLDVEPRPNAWRCAGTLTVPDVRPWWPHTHGDPVTYEARLIVRGGGGACEISLKPVGFRTVEISGPPGPKFSIRINGIPVYLRGTCWVPAGLLDVERPAPQMRQLLEDARDAGINMLRIGGTMVYESDQFYALCDELGILVWQDFMFANMDYPFSDPEFRENVEREVRHQLGRLGHHPCLAVLCGNSEVQQQVAMLGLPAELWQSDWFDRELPSLCAEYRPDAPYWPSSPSGGALPFHTDAGVSHYFGVGGYRRSLDDARLAEPWFATECLALAGVPEPESLDRAFGSEQRITNDPRYLERVPQDAGADWNFLDVTHHYLRELFGTDPDALRVADEARYLHALRVTVGEVMSAVQTSWRTGARCGGALIWLHRDLLPSPGWGLVSSDGIPKSSYYYLKRAWAPLALLVEDAGVNGLRLHLVNDEPADFCGSVEVRCMRYEGVTVAQGKAPVACPARDQCAVAVEAVIGGFIDSTHAYRFGPEAFDLVVFSLIPADEHAGMARFYGVYHPLRRGLLPQKDTGLWARWTPASAGAACTLRVGTAQFAQSVAVSVPGYRPSDNYFHVAPGLDREIVLRRETDTGDPAGFVRALNGVAEVALARAD